MIRWAVVLVGSVHTYDFHFGVAVEEEVLPEIRLVATARGDDPAGALAEVLSCLPAAAHYRLAEGGIGHEALASVGEMLGKLEHGNEHDKHFALSATSLGTALRRILLVAAAIPVGYVTTYGRVAKASGSVARAVGRVMATNPLYPIVPCHRVLGAEFAMVGYGGRQDSAALRAKLDRLAAEKRDREIETEVDVIDELAGEQASTVGTLTVSPVEWALAAEDAARLRSEAHEHQLMLF